MSAALGTRKPAHRLMPPRAKSAVREVVELLAGIGVTLDPWQVDVLTAGMVATAPAAGSRTTC